MNHYSPVASSRITDYRTDFEYELTFVPPAAAWNPKQQQQRGSIEEARLLNPTDTSYKPQHVQTSYQRRTRLKRGWYNLETKWERFEQLFYHRVGRYFVIHDPDNPRGHLQGWRRAVVTAASFTGFVLVVNTVFMIVVLAKYHTDDGVGVLYTGDCGLVKSWNTGLHLTINVLGTIVLAASSFTMQCLCSPNRSEVDAAHAKRVPLEIGLVSFRNLFYVKAWKGSLWVLLCLSTMPLHLLWNSTIFSTTSTNYFSYLVTQEGFLTGAGYLQPNQSLFESCSRPYRGDFDLDAMINTLYTGYQQGHFVELDSAQCLDAYNVDFLNTRRNLIVVVEQSATPDTMSSCGYGQQQYTSSSSVIGLDANWEPGTDWIDDTWTDSANRRNSTVLRDQIAAIGTWTIGGMRVQSCQSEVVNAAQCKLQFVSYILYVVVTCNAIKLTCMCIAARYLWNLDEPLLATVGDAVCSFLDHTDETTKGYCLLDHKDVARGVWRKKHVAYNPTYRRDAKRRLYFSTSHVRWWLTMLPLTLYVCAGFALWKLSLGISDYDYKETMKLKFGAVDSGLTLGLAGDSGRGLITDIVVANSFQVVLSATYFLYNSLYTAQCAALEWSTYVGSIRQYLRVTWPRGQQRMSYYLHLPYRYGIPLTTLLLLVHFLISQSIFLARLQYKDWEGNLTNNGFADVGFSPRATLTTCLVGLFMVLAQIVHSFRTLDTRIPIHGNSSAVISAMCHPKKSDEAARESPWSQNSLSPQNLAQPGGSLDAQLNSASTEPLLWGVTHKPPDWVDANSAKEGSGHCSFTADLVDSPERGKQYR